MTASHKTDTAMAIIKSLPLIQAQLTDFEENG